MLQISKKQLRHNILVLFTAGFLFWCSMGSLLPTLPLYMQTVGANRQQIGIVMGCFAIGILLSRRWMGKMSDSYGRKIVLLIGTSVVAISPLCYLAVSSLPLLMLIRTFHGVSIAAFATAYLALVVDLTHVSRHGEAIGYMSLVNPLGMAVGPAVGAYLQAEMGYSALFIASSFFGLLALLCIVSVIDPPTHKQPTTVKQKGFWTTLASPRVKIPFLVMFFLGVNFGTLHTFISLFIKDTGVDLNAGLFYVVGAIASFSFRLFGGRASDQFGRGLLITVSLAVYGLGMFFIWQANDINTFLWGAFLEGAGYGTAVPIITAMMSDRSRAYERGQIFAVCIMGLDLGIAIAGPIIGYIAQQYGYRNVFALATLLTLCAILVFLAFSSKNIQNSISFALGKGRDFYALNNNPPS
nr:MFS transporter [Richelia intracellularis]